MRSQHPVSVQVWPGSFESYLADCANDAARRQVAMSDEERIPWWVHEEIALWEEKAACLRRCFPPTEQTLLAWQQLEGHRLTLLGKGMAHAQMAPDETIAAYLARIGISERLIAATLARREHLQAECQAYWRHAVEQAA